MYDEEVAPRGGARLYGDEFEAMSARAARPQRQPQQRVGYRVERAAPVASIASRLVVLVDSDAPTTQMVALISAARKHEAGYIASAMRSHRNATFRVSPAARIATLGELGVGLEISGRTEGGLYFRVVARAPTLPKIQTARGQVTWRASFSEWVHMHRACEQELLP